MNAYSRINDVFVQWTDDNITNVVYKDDVALLIDSEEGLFLGIEGSMKGQKFYESNKNYRVLEYDELVERGLLKKKLNIMKKFIRNN